MSLYRCFEFEGYKEYALCNIPQEYLENLGGVAERAGHGRGGAWVEGVHTIHGVPTAVRIPTESMSIEAS